MNIILHVARCLGSVVIYLWAVFSMVLLAVALTPVGAMRTNWKALALILGTGAPAWIWLAKIWLS